MFNLLGSALALPKQIYLIMGTTALFALVASLLGTWFTVGASRQQNKETMTEQEKLQEDAQDFTHNERIEQNEYEQQMHEFNLVNDPLLQSKGLQSAGVSAAGAAQALVGAPSTGFSPTASNQGSGIATAPNMNASTNAFQGIGQAFSDYFTNKLNEQKVEESKSQVTVNQAQIDKWVKDIEQRGTELGIQQESVDIARVVANSQVDLNDSQIDLNMTSMRRIASEIQLNFAKIENLDADTVLKYVEASKVVAETTNIEVDTTLKEAQAQLVYSQTQGQNLQNLDQQMINYLKSIRVEASSLLGCDVDADECTRVLEAMALGQWESVSKLLDTKSYMGNDMLAYPIRTGASQGFGKVPNTKKLRHHYGFSPSMQSDWNNGLYQHNSSKSFRW